MNNTIIQELNICIHLCARLESLIEQNEEALAECLTGEVYRRYVEIFRDMLETIAKLKHQTYTLHDEYQSIM